MILTLVQAYIRLVESVLHGNVEQEERFDMLESIAEAILQRYHILRITVGQDVDRNGHTASKVTRTRTRVNARHTLSEHTYHGTLQQ